MVQPLRVKGRVNVLLETRSPECGAALHYRTINTLLAIIFLFLHLFQKNI